MIDESGFDRLYRQTAAPLRAYAARVMGSAARADDIVQEAYLRLLRTPPAIDDPDQLRAYLFRIASNLMRDQWRHEQRERQSADGLASGSATMNPDLALRLDMTRLFEQLRPQQRQLMWLAYVEGYDHREIGAALGLGERSVRVLLHRARRKLAGLLRQRGRGAGETR